MIRALWSSCRALPLALAIVALLGPIAGSVAHAGKQKIAILGLEVIGDIDSEQTDIARKLTNELRGRAKAGTSNLQLAPNSERELVDEKLMNGCVNEANTCMAPIGANLGADYLMFGKLEKIGRSFQISIKLIKVSTKAQWVWSSEVAPKDLSGNTAAVAKKVYASLIPQEEGTLVVKVTNVDRATIYIDDEPRGTLTSNVFSIGLKEGRYKLAIEASGKGWKRHEETITIHAGDTRNVSTELARSKQPVDDRKLHDELTHEVGGTVSEGPGGAGKFWKVTAATGIAVSAVAGGMWAYQWFVPISKYQDGKEALAMPGGGLYTEKLGSEDCDGKGRDARELEAPRNRDYDAACKAYGTTKILVPVTIAAGAIGIGALIYVLVKSDSPPESTQVGSRRVPRRTFTVTPVMSPDGAGATVRFDW